MANFCLGKATVPFHRLILHVTLQEEGLYWAQIVVLDIYIYIVLYSCIHLDYSLLNLPFTAVAKA
jgi:hypothetical protein